MSNDKKLGFDTLQIHGGAMPDATTGPDKPPFTKQHPMFLKALNMPPRSIA